MVHFRSFRLGTISSLGIGEISLHEAMVGIPSLFHPGISNQKQLSLLLIPEILGEYSLCFPIQVQNVLVGYEEPLVQENMTS
jgi:hypothetical protein